MPIICQACRVAEDKKDGNESDDDEEPILLYTALGFLKGSVICVKDATTSHFHKSDFANGKAGFSYPPFIEQIIKASEKSDLYGYKVDSAIYSVYKTGGTSDLFLGLENSKGRKKAATT